MARVLRDHRRARLLQSPCAAHLAAAGGVELERVGLMAGLLARLGDIRRKEGRKEGRRGEKATDRIVDWGIILRRLPIRTDERKERIE